MADPTPLVPVDQAAEDREALQAVIDDLQTRLDQGRLRGLVAVQLLDGPITHGCTYAASPAGLYTHEAVYLLERAKLALMSAETLLAADQV